MKHTRRFNPTSFLLGFALQGGSLKVIHLGPWSWWYDNDPFAFCPCANHYALCIFRRHVKFFVTENPSSFLWGAVFYINKSIDRMVRRSFNLSFNAAFLSLNTSYVVKPGDSLYDHDDALINHAFKKMRARLQGRTP